MQKRSKTAKRSDAVIRKFPTSLFNIHHQLEISLKIWLSKTRQTRLFMRAVQLSGAIKKNIYKIQLGKNQRAVNFFYRWFDSRKHACDLILQFYL